MKNILVHYNNEKKNNCITEKSFLKKNTDKSMYFRYYVPFIALTIFKCARKIGIFI